MAKALSKLRKSAEGRDCTARIPGVCCFDPEKVSLAHLNGAGMAMKNNDIHGSFCCTPCHDAIDGRTQTKFTPDELKLMQYDSVIETQTIWLEEGFIFNK